MGGDRFAKKKAVLISIKPKWCELIASKRKTIEIRKSKPKLETPFKVYIYCKQTSPWNPSLIYDYEDPDGNIYRDGKRYSQFASARVIGEFICENIETDTHGEHGIEFEIYGCMPFEEQKSYAPKVPLYGWYISDLKMYNSQINLWDFKAVSHNANCDQNDYVIRPPHGWMYVEEKGVL